MTRLPLMALVVAVGISVGLGAAAAAPGSSEARWVAVRLPGSNPQANALNGRGWVVGDTDVGSCYHAALWVSGRLRDLGTLGGRCSVANDVNDRGQVVGWSLTKGESWRSVRAFLWENGKMRDLGIVCGEATAINGRGQVVGGVNGDCAKQRAWMWENGKVRWLVPSFGAESTATDVNERGQAVGWSTRGVFLFRNGNVQMLGIQSDYLGAAINDLGQVVTSGTGRLWRNGGARAICTIREGCVLSAINNRGQVVGCRDFKSVFVWQNGRRTPLPIPQGTTERCANDIDDRGQAVGYSQEGPLEGGQYWAWLWKPAK